MRKHEMIEKLLLMYPYPEEWYKKMDYSQVKAIFDKARKEAVKRTLQKFEESLI